MPEPEVDTQFGRRLWQDFLRAGLHDEAGEVPPAESLTTLTVDGVEGKVRDHFTLRSPIFGRRSFCPSVMDQRAFAVNRTVCRVSLRDL